MEMLLYDRKLVKNTIPLVYGLNADVNKETNFTKESKFLNKDVDN